MDVDSLGIVSSLDLLGSPRRPEHVLHEVLCRPEEFVLGTPPSRSRSRLQCSGYEGIGLIWVFLGVFYWWFRNELRFPQALLLIPLGTVLSWAPT